ncbi:MAG: hypothetical protein A2V66_10685 [Ignavibacteria bacterium RBG_13_36_8]|nr:MAG: hypothetical protein A2V66_10685 [Ignavibacteria bacterium RBG_13_36_8]
MRKQITKFCLVLFTTIIINAQQSDFPKLTGPYLGQKPPGMKPEIFAPGIISSEHQEHSSLSFSPDRKEMWWSRWHLPRDFDKYPQEIMFIKYEKEMWSKPMAAPFSGIYRDGGPAFSPDGNRIYFYSRRPVHRDSVGMNDNDIWYVERIKNGWSQPVNLCQPVNTPFVEATPCLAANGNLYFTSDRNQYVDPTGNNDLFVSKFIDGKYTEPESVSDSINTSSARESFPYIAPDESYIIFSRDNRKFDSEGNVIEGDRKLMISFRWRDGAWRSPVEMGPDYYKVRFPSVSPDGKYLFFTKYSEKTDEDFYWVDAKVIEELRPKE